MHFISVEKHQPKAVTIAICVWVFTQEQLENYRSSCKVLIIINLMSHVSDDPQQPLRYIIKMFKRQISFSENEKFGCFQQNRNSFLLNH